MQCVPGVGEPGKVFSAEMGREALWLEEVAWAQLAPGCGVDQLAGADLQEGLGGVWRERELQGSCELELECEGGLQGQVKERRFHLAGVGSNCEGV